MSIPAPGRKLVVVGGGFSCLALVSRLRGHADTKDLLDSGALSIVIYEASGVVGPGPAWRPDLPEEYLSNVPSAFISTLVPLFGGPCEHMEQAQAFLASEAGAGVGPGDFVPRRRVGQFFVDAGKKAVDHAAIKVVPKAVTKVSRSQGGYLVEAEGEEPCECSWIVLATGAPAASGSRAARFGDVEGVLCADASNEVPRDASVGIVGTGLTAVDTLRLLRLRGHTGPIVMASRNGRFPPIHRPHFDPSVLAEAPFQMKQCTAAAIASLPDGLDANELFMTHLKPLVEADLAELGPGFMDSIGPQAVTDGVAELEKTVADYDTGETFRWQSAVVFGMAPLVAHVWGKLSEAGQKEVLGSPWARVFHNCMNPMPVESGKVVLEASRAGMTVRSGLKAVTRTPSGFTLDSEGNSDPVQHVVDCTGAEFRLSQGGPMFQSLLEAGILTEHHAGGAVCHPGTLQADQAGGGVFVMGHLVRSAHYMTSGLTYCLIHASMVSAVLREKVKAP